MIYDAFKESQMRGDIDLLRDPVFAVLVGEKYLPSPAHSTRADVSDEASSSVELRGRVIEDEAGTAVFRADNLEWLDSSITARGVVVYVAGGGGARDRLICHSDFGATMRSVEGPFVVKWANDGILRLQ